MPYLRAIEGVNTIATDRFGYNDDTRLAFRFSANLHNRGNGIAVTPRMYVERTGKRFNAVNVNTDSSPALPPIGPGDFVTTGDWNIWAITDTSYSPEAAREPYAFTIEYDDIFGKTFKTIYDGTNAVRFVQPQ